MAYVLKPPGDAWWFNLDFSCPRCGCQWRPEFGVDAVSVSWTRTPSATMTCPGCGSATSVKP